MTRFREVLRIVTAHGVDYIVVGGISAVLNGAPVSTFDLDIVHSRGPGNIGRLLASLEELEAEYRYTGGRSLKPAESHLASKGPQSLNTRFGPVDVLGMIGRDLSCQDLLPRILNLEVLIEIKEQLGTEKDRASLPLLRRTLEERGRT